MTKRVVSMARAVQNMSMYLTGFSGKRRRTNQNIRTTLRQTSEQAGKPQVIANRMPDAAKWRVMNHSLVARCDRSAFSVQVLLGQLNVKQMYLVTSAPDRAGIVQHDAPVQYPPVRRIHGDGSKIDPNLLACREYLHFLKKGMRRFGTSVPPSVRKPPQYSERKTMSAPAFTAASAKGNASSKA
jgi:hypothetical protein